MVKKFTKRENEICEMLAWLACHADEDCPAEYRTKWFRYHLKKSIDWLEDSGWYEFNKKKSWVEKIGLPKK
jgi:hypothetical protein